MPGNKFPVWITQCGLNNTKLDHNILEAAEYLYPFRFEFCLAGVGLLISLAQLQGKWLAMIQKKENSQSSFRWIHCIYICIYIQSNSCVVKRIRKELSALAVNSGEEEKVSRCAMLLKLFLYGGISIIYVCDWKVNDWSNNGA